MTEQELRAIVRDAVARRLGTSSIVDRPSSIVQGQGGTGLFSTVHQQAGDRPAHPSHATYLNLVNIGGECVIEPSVPCNHCNYCKSHGH